MQVHISNTRQESGALAAEHIAEALRAELQIHRRIAVLFASAPSQAETLAALSKAAGIDWPAISPFHLDEYCGASAAAPHSFRRFLMDHLLSKVSAAPLEGLRGESENLDAECLRYADALELAQPAIALLGIGENGHLAFNDPPLSRFDEPSAVRRVTLTPECREQQVHDGAFPTVAGVPLQALTVSIPAIMQTPALFVMVPGIRKAQAVRDALEGQLSEACPASILRTHPNATLFLDRDSASLLTRN